MRILFLAVPITIFCLATILLDEVGFAIPLVGLFTLLAIGGLVPFLTRPAPLLFSPGRLYALSIFAFILARSFINLFTNVELVEVGNGINSSSITKALAVVALSIWVSNILYSISSPKRLISFDAKLRLRFPVPKYLTNIVLFGAISAGSYFLLQSWVASQLLSSLDYFTAVDDPIFHEHIKYFLVSKSLMIIWIALSMKKRKIFLGASILFIFSVGFLFIGLRGYFISYFFLFLYFYNEKHEVKFFPLLVGALLLLYGSSFILEYRLGFKLFDNVFDMITSPIYQQGASFEVVFGAVTFPDEVSKCISMYEFFTKAKPFGDCVDLARGVPFVEGGFASSFFAEGYYTSLFFLILISAFLGTAVRFCDELSRISTTSTNRGESFVAAFILFLIIPNLVYFARSSVFDFLFKLIASCSIVFLFYVVNYYNSSRLSNLVSKS